MVLKSVSWSDKWYVTNKKSDKGDHNATFNAWSKPYRSFKGVFIHSPLASLAWTIQRRTIQTKQNGLRISLWSVLPQWLTVWLPPRRLASIFRCCSEHGFVNVEYWCSILLLDVSVLPNLYWFAGSKIWLPITNFVTYGWFTRQKACVIEIINCCGIHFTPAPQ